MSAAVRIAIKDLKLRVRDRSAFIIGIIAPLALAFIFNAIFGGAATGDGLGLDYGMVDLDRTEISGALTAALEGAEEAELLTLEAFSDAAAASSAVEEGRVDAYFVVPEGFGRSITTNQAAEVRVVGDVDSPTATRIAASFAEQFASRVATGRLAVATTASVLGVPITSDLIEGFSADPASAGEIAAVIDRSAETRQLDASTYFAAGMAVFFLFFTVQFGVAGLLEEERDGTLARLMAAPIGRLSVIAAKAILALVLGLVSMMVLVIATSLLMGAEWGSWAGVALLVVTGVLAAVGIMGVVASMARTPEGAGNLGSIIAVILGMLGGTFFPIGAAGGVLSAMTFLTPHAWFLRGLGDLAGGAAWTAALPSAAAIFAFAALSSALAWVMLRRRWAA